MRVKAHDIIFSAMMLFQAPAFANDKARGQADEKASDGPAIALLEFLGEWTDEDGAEIDFDMLEQARLPTRSGDRAPTVLKQ